MSKPRARLLDPLWWITWGGLVALWLWAAWWCCS